MNFSEELALAGALELTDGELEIIQGGANINGVATTLAPHMGGHFGHHFGGHFGGHGRYDDYDQYPFFGYPYPYPEPPYYPPYYPLPYGAPEWGY